MICLEIPGPLLLIKKKRVHYVSSKSVPVIQYAVLTRLLVLVRQVEVI